MKNRYLLLVVIFLCFFVFASSQAQDKKEETPLLLDTDNDGAVSDVERNNFYKVFIDRYDTNQDGVISQKEMEAVSPKDRTAFEQYLHHDFKSMDRDGDGVISRLEWKQNPMSFERIDKDNDETLTSEEYANSGIRLGF